VGWGTSIFPLLIVTSSSGFTGLFVYSPGPGAGNLIASISSGVGTDPFGNTVNDGIWAYGSGEPVGAAGAFGAFAELLNASVRIGDLAMTQSATLSAAEQGASPQSQPTLLVQAPEQAGSLDAANVIVLGGDTASVKHGQVLIALSTTATPDTNELFEVQGRITIVETSAPATPAGAGVLYVDATGHLRYKGPLGTDTLLANP